MLSYFFTFFKSVFMAANRFINLFVIAIYAYRLPAKWQNEWMKIFIFAGGNQSVEIREFLWLIIIIIPCDNSSETSTLSNSRLILDVQINNTNTAVYCTARNCRVCKISPACQSRVEVSLDNLVHGELEPTFIRRYRVTWEFVFGT